MSETDVHGVLKSLPSEKQLIRRVRMRSSIQPSGDVWGSGNLMRVIVSQDSRNIAD
jgi:hypothetical protein